MKNIVVVNGKNTFSVKSLFKLPQIVNKLHHLTTSPFSVS